MLVQRRRPTVPMPDRRASCDPHDRWCTSRPERLRSIAKLHWPGPAVKPLSGTLASIENRISFEEPDGDEPEAGLMHGHDGPVLATRIVRDAKRVPHNDVGAGEGAVRGAPSRKAVAPN